jgi:hypothetical protein
MQLLTVVASFVKAEDGSGTFLRNIGDHSQHWRPRPTYSLFVSASGVYQSFVYSSSWKHDSSIYFDMMKSTEFLQV